MTTSSNGEVSLRALFSRAGAEWLDVPVLHPADPFLETAGEDIRRRMFVTEGPAGERLALRPDFTIPVCLAHLANSARPKRYAYEGLVFRRHDSGAPERLETGYEDIGGDDPLAADAEAVALAVSAAALAANGALSVRLGDIGLFVALTRALGLPGRWRRRLRRSFGLPETMAANLARLSAAQSTADARLDQDMRTAAEAHDREALVALLADRTEAHGNASGAGRSPEEIADRYLEERALAEAHIDPRVLDALRAFLRLESPLADAAPLIEGFATERNLDLSDVLPVFALRAERIAALSPEALLRFEAGFGRPLDYYTGLVFEVRVGGQAAPIVGGGRYDRLMEMLGAPAPVPAVGFTLRLDLARAAVP
jgi:ATP phosphoribosyltransferase regulatory subunit